MFEAAHAVHAQHIIVLQSSNELHEGLFDAIGISTFR
jgi:hypothetical protein